MQVRYELTFDDFAEAWFSSRVDQKWRGFGRRSNAWSHVGFVVATTLVLTALFWLSRDPRERFEFTPDEIADAVAGAAPWLVLAVLYVVQLLSACVSRKTIVVMMTAAAVMGLGLAAFELR